MLAISNQGMEASIGDSEVGALLIGTGEALGVNPLGRSPATFHLTPGSHRRRFHHRRVGAGEAAVGAVKWGAWLEQTADHGVHCPYLPVGTIMMEQTKATKPCQGKQEKG